MRRRELAQGRELDDRFGLGLEQNRQYDQISRRRLTETRADADVIARNVREQNAAFLESALTDEPGAEWYFDVVLTLGLTGDAPHHQGRPCGSQGPFLK